MVTMKDLAALLGVKLGEEFRISGSKWLYKFDDNGLMYKDKDKWEPYETASMLCRLFAGSKEIVKLPWKPGHNERYFRIGGSSLENADIFDYCFDGVIEDYINYAAGNCFITKEEAEAHKEEVITRLKSIYENGISTDTGREEQKPKSQA